MKTLYNFDRERFIKVFNNKRVIDFRGKSIIFDARYHNSHQPFLPDEYNEEIVEYLEDYIKYIKDYIEHVKIITDNFSISINNEEIRIYNALNIIEKEKNKEIITKKLKNELLSFSS